MHKNLHRFQVQSDLDLGRCFLININVGHGQILIKNIDSFSYGSVGQIQKEATDLTWLQ